jgi:hypothetical protein
LSKVQARDLKAFLAREDSAMLFGREPLVGGLL